MDKKEFINNWLDDNWPAFVAGTFCDHRGKLVTVADALQLTAIEACQINVAFMLGACATHEAIEVIAKAYLIAVAANPAWGLYHAELEDRLAAMADERAEMAFCSHDLNSSGFAGVSK